METGFYTISELIKLLQVSRITLYRYIRKGDLVTYKFGKAHRVSERDFSLFLEKYKNKKGG